MDDKIEPGEAELEQLNRQLKEIGGMISRGIRPAAAVTYFIPDPLKAGGRYETIRERIRKVDPAAGTLVLERKTGASGSRMTIPIEDILRIEYE